MKHKPILLKMKFKRIGFFLIATLLFSACSQITAIRPEFEIKMAQSAFSAAKDAGAESTSSKDFRLAELALIKAKNAYKKKSFDQAKKFALLSIKYAEKAELEVEKNKVLKR